MASANEDDLGWQDIKRSSYGDTILNSENSRKQETRYIVNINGWILTSKKFKTAQFRMDDLACHVQNRD